MRQFRKDPLSDRWVAFAEEREKRPNEYDRIGRRRPGTRCPFCAGNESDTPPAIAAYAPGVSGAEACQRNWQVRVVPNKYPAFQGDGDPKIVADGIYAGTQAVGAHEVIIESRRHVASLADLNKQELALVMRAYSDRLRILRDTGEYRYALLFKNVGPQAGASLEHSHSQIIATPFVPPEVAQEVAGADRLYREHQACFFCRMINDEAEHQQRLVAQTKRFLALCPYASRMPYEMWILPRSHASHFFQQDDKSLAELGLLLQKLVRKLESLHGHLAYNYYIHTAPFDTSRLRHYHWHIEIFPRLTTTAGFEWGAGYYINPVPPEQAAAVVRSGSVPKE